MVLLAFCNEAGNQAQSDLLFIYLFISRRNGTAETLEWRKPFTPSEMNAAQINDDDLQGSKCHTGVAEQP